MDEPWELDEASEGEAGGLATSLFVQHSIDKPVFVKVAKIAGIVAVVVSHQ